LRVYRRWANDLARKIITNEARTEAADRSHWAFYLEKKNASKGGGILNMRVELLVIFRQCCETRDTSCYFPTKAENGTGFVGKFVGGVMPSRPK
jgi:hypothetical protein